MKTPIRVSLVVALSACGPNERPEGTTTDAPLPPDAMTACVGNADEICDNQLDEDCDGLIDCRDPDCSGIGDCPVCGMVQRPEGQPLALPDGEGTSYTSTVMFTGFAPGRKIETIDDFDAICVNMEHSWLRDLQIELHAPSGEVLMLQKFLGKTGSRVTMGSPVHNDDAAPTPGTGSRYCWATLTVRPSMLSYASQQGGIFGFALPPGNYAPSEPISKLIGAEMNGAWTLKVTDLWAQDNGFIFSWSIAFDPNTVQDCSTPPIQ